VKGRCWVSIDGEPEPIRFETGDVGLLAAKRSFVLASDLSVAPVDAMAVFSGAGSTTAILGDGDDFAHIGGHVLLDPASGRLLADVLPPWIHVPTASPQAASFRWLLHELVEEQAKAALCTSPNALFCVYALGWIHLYDELPQEAGGLIKADGRKKLGYFAWKDG